jgi:hypothetical protein
MYAGKYMNQYGGREAGGMGQVIISVCEVIREKL